MSYWSENVHYWQCDAPRCQEKFIYKQLQHPGAEPWQPPPAPPGWVALTAGIDWSARTFIYCPKHIAVRPTKF